MRAEKEDEVKAKLKLSHTSSKVEKAKNKFTERTLSPSAPFK